MNIVFKQFGIVATLMGMSLPIFAQNEVIGMPKNAAERARVLEDKKTTLPREMNGVGIEEKLGQKVDLNLSFVGEGGKLHRLADYFASYVERDVRQMLKLVYAGSQPQVRDAADVCPWLEWPEQALKLLRK